MKTTASSKPFSHFFRDILLTLLLFTVLGRFLNHLYGITYTDVLYAEWISTVLGYALDGLSCLRYVLGFGAVLYAQWKWGMGEGNILFVTVTLCSFADIVVRFLIDLLTNSITGMEGAALTWLLLQFAYDMIVLALCWITGRMFRLRYAMSDSVRRAERYSLPTAFRLSLLYVLILRLGMWVWDVVDFCTTYSDIQSYEYASMAGQFLFVAVLYGGAAFLFSELILWCLSRRYGTPDPEKTFSAT